MRRKKGRWRGGKENIAGGGEQMRRGERKGEMGAVGEMNSSNQPSLIPSLLKVGLSWAKGRDEP